MSLIGIIADTHLGTSNNNNYFLEYHADYFLDIKDYLVKRGITDLIHVGDLYDVRKSINFKTLRKSSDFFTRNFLEAPFQTHIIVGNHDSYNKDSLRINAPRELLGWSAFKIYDAPQEIEINGLKLAIVPWMCRSNVEECLYFLDSTMADVCMGHFDISGFSMTKNIINTAGLSRNLFRKFKRTFSGHFHLPSTQDNIIYVGSPYQLSWNDYDVPKRIILYDTETNEIEYVYNEKRIFEKIYYQQDMKLEQDYHNKIVKIYANGSYDKSSFDIFVEAVNKQYPYKCTVIESVDYTGVEGADTAAKKDTMEFLVEYIDQIDFQPSTKADLKNLMLITYNEAQEQR